MAPFPSTLRDTVWVRRAHGAVWGVLWVLGMLFSPTLPARAAIISFDARNAALQRGDVVVLPLRLDTEGACVNAVEVVVRYDRNLLTAVDVGRGRSILSLWPEVPKIDKGEGVVRFSGGIPGGYCGGNSNGPDAPNILADIAFLVQGAVQEPQEARVSIDFTRVYAHDGRGTLLPTTARSSVLTVAPYLARPARDEWLARVRQDTVAPELFSIVLNNDPAVADGRYYIAFSTTDKQSGIDHYEVREVGAARGVLPIGKKGAARWEVAASPYVLKDQSLRSVIEVKAVDKAGNARVVRYQPPAAQTRAPYRRIPLWGWGIALVGGAALVALWWRVRQRRLAGSAARAAVRGQGVASDVDAGDARRTAE